MGDGGTAYLAVETGGAVLASSLEQHTQLAALAHTGGRPAGMALHPDGSLVVCDIIKVCEFGSAVAVPFYYPPHCRGGARAAG